MCNAPNARRANTHPFPLARGAGDRLATPLALRDNVAGALAPSVHDVSVERDVRASPMLERAGISLRVASSGALARIAQRPRPSRL